MNEADTCRTYVVPRLQAAGWENAPYSIAEQQYFTNPKGRVRVVGGRIVRGHANGPIRVALPDGYLADRDDLTPPDDADAAAASGG